MSTGIDSSPEESCEPSTGGSLLLMGLGLMAHPVGALVLGSV